MRIKLGVISLVCAGAFGVAMLGALGAVREWDTSAMTPPGDASASTSREEIAARMVKTVTASPVLHMAVRCLHRGEKYEVQGWMTATKVRCEVRKAGKVVFAQIFADGRAQEYVPQAEFKNGTEATGVLVEYDAPLDKMDDWQRLIDQDLACGPGGVASNSWLKAAHPTEPEMIAENLQSADATMSETILDGKPCYWFHIARGLFDGSTLTGDVYIDKSSYEPLRQSRVVEKDGKKIKDDIFDYTFEHLSDDKGIEWKLDPAKLAK